MTIRTSWIRCYQELVGLEEFEGNHEARELVNRLKGKQVLGNRPLTVIMCDMARDFAKMLRYGEAHGHGDVETRRALGNLLEHWTEDDERVMRAYLELSNNGRFVKATGKAQTHNCHMVDPGFVVDEIRQMLLQCVG